MLVGINISDTWLHAAASALRCKVGKVPFLYLRLSIGGDPRRLSFWTDAWLDTWQWQPDLVRGYTVLGAYQILTSQQLDPMDIVDDLIWHKQVPLIVSIFALRLLRDRLPTRDNLARRDIISPETRSCVAGCGGVESTQHLFLSCSTFGPLWSSVRAWIGLLSVDPLTLSDHFL
ncbi:hypothetical protein TSUD_86490 [Trifolium subterraneum]|uniref:Reverse transcriptase zinc-binding domain-containing protein n=1 Tax=Trifolium subterraneum TaxID=3900 RepID=A0A2Z6NGP5_TRISU|nr:hypothetical protein TSUD_86490 [Trifolium subterraneum]